MKRRLNLFCLVNCFSCLIFLSNSCAQEVEIFPKKYKTLPDIASPATLKNGTEVIINVSGSGEYSVLPVTQEKGEIYGFLGLNGAGKTTTIRMLLGLIRPTSGASYICGRQVRAGENDIWKNIGYLVEVPYSYPELTVRENLEIIQVILFLL